MARTIEIDAIPAQAQGRLRTIVERIERLEEDKADIASDIKDVFAEAKGEGFDVKILRKVIRLRKMDKTKRETEEALTDLYMHAIEQPQLPFDPPAKPARPLKDFKGSPVDAGIIAITVNKAIDFVRSVGKCDRKALAAHLHQSQDATDSLIELMITSCVLEAKTLKVLPPEMQTAEYGIFDAAGIEEEPAPKTPEKVTSKPKPSTKSKPQASPGKSALGWM